MNTSIEHFSLLTLFLLKLLNIRTKQAPKNLNRFLKSFVLQLSWLYFWKLHFCYKRSRERLWAESIYILSNMALGTHSSKLYSLCMYEKMGSSVMNLTFVLYNQNGGLFFWISKQLYKASCTSLSFWDIPQTLWPVHMWTRTSTSISSEAITDTQTDYIII